MPDDPAPWAVVSVFQLFFVFVFFLFFFFFGGVGEGMFCWGFLFVSHSHFSLCHLTNREAELAWELQCYLHPSLWESKSVGYTETDKPQVGGGSGTPWELLSSFVNHNFSSLLLSALQNM